MLEKVREILDYWFGTDKTNWLSQSERWFAQSTEIDDEIRQQFLEIHQRGAEGKLEPWRSQSPTCLAYIILLDQFSRNMYRNSPLAFAQDAMALAACEHGREDKLDKDLPLIQRMFFYMPLMHSEELSAQKTSVALMRQLIEEARSRSQVKYLQALQKAQTFAQKHYDIISNFGRFPHRNAILERESTQGELVFLNQNKSFF
jgi:uncharacterized protein (DUF924 family)